MKSILFLSFTFLFSAMLIAHNTGQDTHSTFDGTPLNEVEEEQLMRAVPPGEGIIDYKTWFKALKEIGYQGWAVYEMCEVLDGGGSIKNLDRTAKIFIEFMEEFK